APASALLYTLSLHDALPICELRAGEESARDQDLPESPVLLALERERALELRVGDQAQLHEHLPERAPGLCRLEVGCRHRLDCLVVARLQLDAVLLGQDAGEGERREVTVVDEDLSEEPATARLFGERLLELLFGEELLGNEQLAELSPGELKCCCLHLLSIGRNPLV